MHSESIRMHITLPKQLLESLIGILDHKEMEAVDKAISIHLALN